LLIFILFYYFISSHLLSADFISTYNCIFHLFILFTSSYLVCWSCIFRSYIYRSYISKSYIFRSCALSLSLLSSANFYCLLRRGNGHERSRKCDNYAQNEIRSSKIETNCDFELCYATLTARNEKLRKNCDFVWSRSGFPSMISNFDSRKLMKMCDYAEASKSIWRQRPCVL
jgi:hypothetical protein